MKRSCTSRPLVEHALALIAGAAVERPDEASSLRAELEQWRSASPAHESAYQQAALQWRVLEDAGPRLRACFAEPVSATKRKRRARAVLAAMAFVTGVAGILDWHLGQPAFDQAYRTGTAQLGHVPLPDGSRIELNARTDLRVTLYRDRRVVELKHGEAHFDVASDASRPFRVETREGTVEVVGTAFVVSDRGMAVAVDVDHGRVRLVTPDRSRGVELKGGERVSVRHGVPDEGRRSGAREFAPWRDGWLVFDNERLADVLPAINAFRATPVTLADERAGALRLTGRFRASDSRGLLAALPRILPISVTQQPDGSVEIGSR
jgi:transmembrane sensor